MPRVLKPRIAQPQPAPTHASRAAAAGAVAVPATVPLCDLYPLPTHADGDGEGDGDGDGALTAGVGVGVGVVRINPPLSRPRPLPAFPIAFDFDFGWVYLYGAAPPSYRSTSEWLQSRMPNQTATAAAAIDEAIYDRHRPAHGVDPYQLAAFDRMHGLTGGSQRSAVSSEGGGMLPSVTTDRSTARHTLTHTLTHAQAHTAHTPTKAVTPGGSTIHTPIRDHQTTQSTTTVTAAATATLMAATRESRKVTKQRDVFAFPSQSDCSSLSQSQESHPSIPPPMMADGDGDGDVAVVPLPLPLPAVAAASSAMTIVIGETPTAKQTAEPILIEESDNQSEPDIQVALPLVECMEPYHTPSPPPPPPPPALPPAAAAPVGDERRHDATSHQSMNGSMTHQLTHPSTPSRSFVASSMPSTRSLGNAPLTLDPTSILPSVCQLMAGGGAGFGLRLRAPSDSHHHLLQAAQVEAMDRDMRDMDRALKELDQPIANKQQQRHHPTGSNSSHPDGATTTFHLSHPVASGAGSPASLSPPSESQYGPASTPPLAQRDRGFTQMRPAPTFNSMATPLIPMPASGVTVAEQQQQHESSLGLAANVASVPWHQPTQMSVEVAQHRPPQTRITPSGTDPSSLPPPSLDGCNAHDPQKASLLLAPSQLPAVHSHPPSDSPLQLLSDPQSQSALVDQLTLSMPMALDTPVTIVKQCVPTPLSPHPHPVPHVHPPSDPPSHLPPASPSPTTSTPLSQLELDLDGVGGGSDEEAALMDADGETHTAALGTSNASMSLELTFDDEPMENAPEEAQQIPHADAGEKDAAEDAIAAIEPESALIADRPAQTAVASQIDLTIDHSPPPVDHSLDASLHPVLHSILHTPRNASVVSLSSTAAATEVYKGSLTPARSPATALSLTVATAGSHTPTPIKRHRNQRVNHSAKANNDECIATQHLLSASPCKVIPSPIRSTTPAEGNTRQSPAEQTRVPMQPKGLKFDEVDIEVNHEVAVSVHVGADPIPLVSARLPSLSTSSTVTPAMAPTDLVEPSLAFDAAHDAFTPCTPARGSASHPFDTQSQSQSQSIPIEETMPPADTLPLLTSHTATTPTPTPAPTATAAAAATATDAALLAAPSVSIIPAAWSRARKSVVNGASLPDGNEAVDQHGSGTIVVVAPPAPASAESAKRRGKVFAKSVKSHVRVSDEPIVHSTLETPGQPQSRPIIGIGHAQPISLLSETQPDGAIDESQADDCHSVDPMKRARIARDTVRAKIDAIQHNSLVKSPHQPISEIRHDQVLVSVDIKSPCLVPMQENALDLVCAAPIARSSGPVASRPALAPVASSRVTSPSIGQRMSTYTAPSNMARRTTPPPPQPTSTSPSTRTPPSPSPSPPVAFVSFAHRSNGSPTPAHYGKATRILVKTLVRVNSPVSSPSPPRSADKKAHVTPGANSSSSSSPVGITQSNAKSMSPVSCRSLAPVALSAILEESSSNLSVMLTSTSTSAKIPSPAQLTAAANYRDGGAAHTNRAEEQKQTFNAIIHTPMDIDAHLPPPLVSTTSSGAPAPLLERQDSAPLPPLTSESIAPPSNQHADDASPALAAASISVARSARAKRKSATGVTPTSADDLDTPIEEPQPKRTRRAATPGPIAESSHARVAASTAATSHSPPAAAAATASSAKATRKIFVDTQFLLTGLSGHHSLESTQQEKRVVDLILNAGGRVTDHLHQLPIPSLSLSPVPSRILVLASEPKRTMKFMWSLARGLPTLTHSWLDLCIREGRLVVPTVAHIVPLKDDSGATMPIPRPWIRALQERDFLVPLALNRRVFFGLTLCVVGPPSFVSEVCVVLREGGARVFSCSCEDTNGRPCRWKNWNEAEEANTSERARRTNANAARNTPLPPFDLICTDRCTSLTSAVQSRLAVSPSVAGSSGTSVHVVSSLRPSRKSKSPHIVSVKWVSAALIAQKRVPIEPFILHAE